MQEIKKPHGRVLMIYSNGKKSAFGEVNEILTSTNTTLKNAGYIANHFKMFISLKLNLILLQTFLWREQSSFELAEIKSSRGLKVLS